MAEVKIKSDYPKEFQQLLDAIASYNPSYLSETDLLYKAYHFAQSAHSGQFRRSGEPYFVHVYNTALILAQLSMDPVTICAGFLHDVVEDTHISSEVLAQEFSPLIAELVKGVTKIGGIKFYSRQQQQAENFHKMFLSVADDIRVLIIKFADRLHNMRTLYSLPVVKQRRIAIETRDVYAPLASRLGMYGLKTEYEDLSLKYLDSKMYRFLEKRIQTRRKELEGYIVKFTDHIRSSLEKYSINAEIKGRLKHFYSIYRKMKRQNKQFEEIYDILAIRVIVQEVSECYAVLGLVHQEFAPIPHRFRDFIATPKTNGYQSVHTTVVGPDNRLIEVQIRTEKMHRTAEVGIAAHWKYKEERSDDSAHDLETYVKWLRSLIEMLQKDVADDEEFFDTLKVDMFRDEIFVFTPKGDLVTLPLGATALDFAFAVHSEVGVHCIGSKINGKMAPINTKLTSGDRIEILTSSSSNLSYNWLNFVKTSRAKTRIRKWLRQNEFEQSIKLGKEILEKGLRRLKMRDRIKEAEEKGPKEFGFQTRELFFQAIGKGDITLRNIVEKLFTEEAADDKVEKEEESSRISSLLKPFKQREEGIRIQGIDNLMVQFAKCCNPIPGDEIAGFITRGRGITIHRSECNNIPKLQQEQDRFINVSWDVPRGKTFVTHLKIYCSDRKNMIYDISDIIRDSKTNMLSINFTSEGKHAKGNLAIAVESTRHAKRIMDKIKKIPGIISIERT